MNIRKIALIGNPNTGKTSIFNLLTGLNQHVGNFPGVTVDKKTGVAELKGLGKIDVLDLPGTYSIFPRSQDERVVFDIVSNSQHEDFPDTFVVIADASNLERNLLLFSQLYDLNIPVVLALTMKDVADKNDIKLDTQALSARLNGTPVFYINGRTGEGLDKLASILKEFSFEPSHAPLVSHALRDLESNTEGQKTDAEDRYKKIHELIGQSRVSSDHSKSNQRSMTERLDRVIVHPVFGFAIFLGILLLIFQFIFKIASFPMDWIDGSFLQFSQWAKSLLPAGVFTDLIAEGVIPGIGGVVVFVPQIALLFFFLSILEETGYMARVVFIMDRIVRPFGLNGKSVVPLMGSVACAIPGIMATRNINNWKERIITIMVSPLMSCSARIPVYTLLIALVVPEKNVLGFFNLKGLLLFGLYALGLVSALLVAWVMKHFIKSKERSFLIMEMPNYQFPRWKQVFINLVEKVKIFVFDAGKVILAISVLLWALASFGPSQRMEKALSQVEMPSAENGISQEQYEKTLSSVKLENSYVGIVGKGIEPVIAPLGYDWKIGISLITSFAAREVFVGSMAAIYSVGEDFEEDDSLLKRMKNDVNTTTHQPTYTLASGASLMVFYVFAMQCMATFAVVKRETKSWKWPLLQVLYMGVLAYLAAFITYILLK